MPKSSRDRNERLGAGWIFAIGSCLRHIKDRKSHGPNVAVWGAGDTPMKEVLQLLKKEKYPFPANLELEHPISEGSDIIAEAKKCLAYVRNCLV